MWSEGKASKHTDGLIKSGRKEFISNLSHFWTAKRDNTVPPYVFCWTYKLCERLILRPSKYSRARSSSHTINMLTEYSDLQKFFYIQIWYIIPWLGIMLDVAKSCFFGSFLRGSEGGKWRRFQRMISEKGGTLLVRVLCLCPYSLGVRVELELSADLGQSCFKLTLDPFSSGQEYSFEFLTHLFGAALSMFDLVRL